MPYSIHEIRPVLSLKIISISKTKNVETITAENCRYTVSGCPIQASFSSSPVLVLLLTCSPHFVGKERIKMGEVNDQMLCNWNICVLAFDTALCFPYILAAPDLLELMLIYFVNEHFFQASKQLITVHVL